MINALKAFVQDLKDEINDPDGEELANLAEIDLDFAVEAAFRQQAPVDAEQQPCVAQPTEPDQISALPLFGGLTDEQRALVASRCQTLQVVPGYVLYPKGRINSKLYFVLEGQLRLYPDDGSKRASGIVDIGQSAGLSPALSRKPADHALVATESSRLLAIEVPLLEKLTDHSHALAKNFLTLMGSYANGEHCLQVNKLRKPRVPGKNYVDPDTLLHNQDWLDLMLPRITERSRQSGKPLSLVMMKIDRMLEIDREAGVVLSRYILEALGQMMMEYSRPTDLHAIDRHQRLMVVLPDSDLDAARTLATRLRIQSKNLKVDDLELPEVTLSIAIVTLGKDETDQALLERADGLIMKSSRAGGNWLFES